MVKWGKTKCESYKTVTRSKCGRFVIVRRKYEFPVSKVAYLVYYSQKWIVHSFEAARLSDAKEAIENMLEDGEVFDRPPWVWGGFL